MGAIVLREWEGFNYIVKPVWRLPFAGLHASL
jgi:hypothetical protein